LKRAYITISPNVVSKICSGLFSKLPKDAKPIRADVDFKTNLLRIAFEHESFEEVPEGQEMPQVTN